MEVATQAGMVVTLAATADIIMEIMPEASLEGLQEARRWRVTLPIKIRVPLRIRF